MERSLHTLDFVVEQVEHGLACSLHGGGIDVVEVVIGGVPGRGKRSCLVVFGLDDINCRDAGFVEEDMVIDHGSAVFVDEAVAEAGALGNGPDFVNELAGF